MDVKGKVILQLFNSAPVSVNHSVTRR